MVSGLERKYRLTLTVKSTKGIPNVAEKMKRMMDKIDVETIRKRLETKEIKNKPMSGEEISDGESAVVLSNITKWMDSFIGEKGLETEFALWIATNKPGEVVEMFKLIMGDDVGRSLGTLIGVMKRFKKEAEG